MLFYFVRHGQTEANIQGVLAGSGMDSPLTKEGHRQAQALSEIVQDHIPHRLHRVIASNMTRAQQTAGYLAQKLGLPLETHHDLREWHLGEWEGKTYEEFAHLLLGEGEPKQGESRQQFYSRVDRGWRELHHESEPYLIVSHGGVWLALQDLLKMPRFAIENCQLVRVQRAANASDPLWQATVLASGQMR